MYAIPYEGGTALAYRPHTSHTGPSLPEGFWAGFVSGFGTGGKAVVNAGSDTVFSFFTVGGLLADASSNPLTFGVSQQDIYNGYNKSNLIARGSTELLFGIATGGAATFGKGGEVAQALGKGIAALDAGGNAYSAGSGANDAYHNGLGVQNTTQMIVGVLGLAGNAAGAARKAAEAEEALADAAGQGALFAKPKVGAVEFIEGAPDANRTAAYAFLQQAVAEEAAATGAYKRVGMNRPLSEFSGHEHSPDIRPDVTGLTHEGTIDMWEILSPSQDIRRLEGKLQRAMEQLPPEMRGGLRVTDPGDAFR